MTEIEELLEEGNKLDGNGEPENALICYDKLLQIEPDNELVLFNKAITLSKMERSNEALKLYDTVLQINSNYVPAIRSKAYHLSTNREE